MSKIYVSKCKYHNNTDGCSNDELDYVCCSLNDCLYKQAIKQYSKDNKYRRCLDEIEKIANDDSFPSDFDVYEERDFYFNQLCKIDTVLQKIKEVKEGEE